MSQLTRDHLAVRDMTRDFVRREIAPFAAEWDRRPPSETSPQDRIAPASPALERGSSDGLLPEQG